MAPIDAEHEPQVVDLQAVDQHACCARTMSS
jgi:hypothetical protein